MPRTRHPDDEYDVSRSTQPLYSVVNSLRIGDTLVDITPVAPGSSDAVREVLDDTLSGDERILHIHPRMDHVGGSQTIDAIARLPHVVQDGQAGLLHDYAAHLERARPVMRRLFGGFATDQATWTSISGPTTMRMIMSW